jgi:predicted amidophosphoribosyltransferase
MRFLSPMTLIVVVVLAFCLMAGVAIILRYARGGENVSEGTCPQCGAVSRPRARFCSRCGADTSAHS